MELLEPGCSPDRARTSILPSSICASPSVSRIFEPDLPDGQQVLACAHLWHATTARQLLHVIGRTKAAGYEAAVSSVHEPTRETIKTAGGAPGGRTLNTRIKSCPAPRCDRSTCTDSTGQYRQNAYCTHIRGALGPRTGPGIRASARPL